VQVITVSLSITSV